MRTLLKGTVLISCLAGQTTFAEDSYQLSDGRDVAPLEMFKECDACPEMIVLPMGVFLMGGGIGDSRYEFLVEQGEIVNAAPNDPLVGADERPVHRVEADLRLAIGRNEVTHDEWMACVNAGGCSHEPLVVIAVNQSKLGYSRATLGGTHPVINVSYFDMLEYVAWLNSVVGADVYRLPTEAEWEYAARAGTRTRFAQGDELSSDNANFYVSEEELADVSAELNLVYRGTPLPVNMLDAANAWGIRHMSGNVLEKTASCYTDQYLGWSSFSEWRDKSVGASCWRTTRGGSYSGGAEFARVASRGEGPEDYRSSQSGFRIVREFY